MRAAAARARCLPGRRDEGAGVGAALRGRSGPGGLPQAPARGLVTHAALKTIAAFLNTEGGDLLIGVDDDGTVLGIEHDRLETDDKFMRHLAQIVRNGLGDRASTCIDPRTQIVEGKTVCLVSCQRSPEPVYLRWKGRSNAFRRAAA